MRGKWALVEVSSGRACQVCRSGKGCGIGIFSGWMARGPMRLTLPMGTGWCIGDRIDLTITPSLLLKLTWIAYGLPLLLLLGGLAAGVLAAALTATNPDILAGLGGLAGLAGGIWWMRKRAHLGLPIEASNS